MSGSLTAPPFISSPDWKSKSVLLLDNNDHKKGIDCGAEGVKNQTFLFFIIAVVVIILPWLYRPLSASNSGSMRYSFSLGTGVK